MTKFIVLLCVVIDSIYVAWNMSIGNVELAIILTGIFFYDLSRMEKDIHKKRITPILLRLTAFMPAALLLEYHIVDSSLPLLLFVESTLISIAVGQE